MRYVLDVGLERLNLRFLEKDTSTKVSSASSSFAPFLISISSKSNNFKTKIVTSQTVHTAENGAVLKQSAYLYPQVLARPRAFDSFDFLSDFGLLLGSFRAALTKVFFLKGDTIKKNNKKNKIKQYIYI